MKSIIEQIKKQLPKNEAWWNTPDKKDECSKYLVNSLDYLKALLDKALSVNTLMEYGEAYDKMLSYAKGDDRLIKGDNTYNWNANIDREIDMLVLDRRNDRDDLVIYMRLHRGGDVCGNYTDGVLFTINRDDFYETEFELDNTFELEVDGKHYQITPRLTEYHDVYCTETGDSTELYFDDITDDEATKAIKEWAKE